MKSCRDDHRMDLPGVQDLLGALQQAGNLLYQLLMVPKYRITGTHVHCCIFSRVGRYFIVLGLVREGYVPSAAGGFPSGVPRSAACPNSSEDIHKPGNDPGFQMPPARSCLWESCPALFLSRCGSHPLKKLFPSIAQLCAENRISLYSIKSFLLSFSDTSSLYRFTKISYREINLSSISVPFFAKILNLTNITLHSICNSLIKV